MACSGPTAFRVIRRMCRSTGALGPNAYANGLALSFSLAMPCRTPNVRGRPCAWGVPAWCSLVSWCSATAPRFKQAATSNRQHVTHLLFACLSAAAGSHRSTEREIAQVGNCVSHGTKTDRAAAYALHLWREQHVVGYWSKGERHNAPHGDEGDFPLAPHRHRATL